MSVFIVQQHTQKSWHHFCQHICSNFKKDNHIFFVSCPQSVRWNCWIFFTGICPLMSQQSLPEPDLLFLAELKMPSFKAIINNKVNLYMPCSSKTFAKKSRLCFCHMEQFCITIQHDWQVPYINHSWQSPHSIVKVGKKLLYCLHAWFHKS